MVKPARPIESLVPQAFGWHGKLPTRGDFVGRGLPRAFQRTWDDWLQRSLAIATDRLGAETLRERLASMPPWQGLVFPSATDPLAWSLVVVPSADRVGRAYPLLLAECYPVDAVERADLRSLHDRALRVADWLDRIGALASPKDFEAGAGELATTPWPLSRNDDAGDAGSVAALRREHPGARSFWWQPEPFGALPAVRADDWPPRDDLLLAWLDA